MPPCCHCDLAMVCLLALCPHRAPTLFLSLRAVLWPFGHPLGGAEAIFITYASCVDRRVRDATRLLLMHMCISAQIITSRSPRSLVGRCRPLSSRQCCPAVSTGHPLQDGWLTVNDKCRTRVIVFVQHKMRILIGETSAKRSIKQKKWLSDFSGAHCCWWNHF